MTDRHRSDDQIYRYRPVYLGPENLRFPFEARILAYPVAVGFTLLYGALLYALGMHSIFMWPFYALTMACLSTRMVMKWVNEDRPVRSIVAALTHSRRDHRPPGPVTVTYRMRIGRRGP